MEKSRRNFFKKSIVGSLALSSAALSNPLNAAVNHVTAKRAKRVLMLSLDGICVDGFLQAHTPNLDALLKNGALSLSTRVAMPSVTLPNWTSHLTGTGPEQHGVVNNGWKVDNVQLPSVAKDEDGYYPSVFKVLKDNVPGVKTAFYYNWVHLINSYNKKYFDEAFYEENDGYVQSYNKALDFMKANRSDPTVVFLYTVSTDHAGHKYKWMSPEYIKSIEDVDVEIGKLLEKMKKEDLYDDTHIFFLTDHGGIGNGHGGTSPQEMIVPWGIVGPGIAKGKKITETNNTVNTASLILRLFKVEQPQCWIGEVPEFVFA